MRSIRRPLFGQFIQEVGFYRKTEMMRRLWDYAESSLLRTGRGCRLACINDVKDKYGFYPVNRIQIVR